MSLTYVLQAAYIVVGFVVVLSAIYLAVYWLYFTVKHKDPAK